MASERTNLVELLRPVLDTYPDSPVALVGCRSTGIERSCCEYDLAVVTSDVRPANSIRVRGDYLDIYFLSEKEALNPSDAESAVSLAFARTVRDSALLLSSGCSAARAVLSENAKKSAQTRLASALKAIGRTEEAIDDEKVTDADFWLLSAAYDFAFAWLYSAEIKPSPSHLLSQLKQHSQGNSGRFQGFRLASGLETASKSECESRLDSLGVLYDMLDAPLAERSTSLGAGRAAYEVSKNKTTFLTKSSQLAECYCFLGCELVRVLPSLAEAGTARGRNRDHPLPISRIAEGEGKIVSSSVVQKLGLTRRKEEIKSATRALKEQVSELTRVF